jgi:hypothetical protein
MRDWDEILRRHTGFWRRAETDRPLIAVTHCAYQDTESVAQTVGAGEVTPDRIDPRPLLPVYDAIWAARDAAGDDVLPPAELLLGVPWLEAACGCAVFAPDGKSLWPEATAATRAATSISVAANNPWLGKLLEVQAAVIGHAAGRYPVSMSHLRGPADILVAMLGSEQFMTALIDEPERIERLALDVASAWRVLAAAQAERLPAWRGGYVIRQFGLWSPGRSAWLQDDTSGMMSLRHYRRAFLAAFRGMAAYPYGVLHLHAPSLRLADTFAEAPRVRAVNVYFDSPTVTLAAAMPTLRQLQARGMPLVLAKDVYAGFTLAEYDEILDGLSPAGLSVHLAPAGEQSPGDIMEAVRERAAR